MSMGYPSEYTPDVLEELDEEAAALVGRARAGSSYPEITISGPVLGGVADSLISTSAQRSKRYTSRSGSTMATCESRLETGGRSISSSSSRAVHPSQVIAYDSRGDVSVTDTACSCACGRASQATGRRQPTPRDVFGGGAR